VIERRTDGGAQPAAPLDSIEALLLDGLTNELTECAARLRAGGLTVSTEVAYGNVVSEILAAADAADVAITVISTHGAGRLDRLLVGSVADKVMRMSTRPTLLVSPLQADAGRQSAALTHLLAPLDGSRLAESALPLAAALAARAGARLTLARVVAPVSMRAPPFVTAAAQCRLPSEAETAAHTYLEKVRGGLSGPEHRDAVVLHGEAAGAISDYVAHAAVDLVVMATHGRGGLRRLVLGSTADRLVRSGVTVLLVRPSQQTLGAAWSPGSPHQTGVDATTA
jgi:nucleotide-binding universal stress UspA family protein